LAVVLLAGCGGDGKSKTGENAGQTPSQPSSIQGTGGIGEMIEIHISVYFKATERARLMPFVDALNKYKHLEGHFPKSQQEFRDGIINEYPALLANLPDRAELIYHPEMAAELTICELNNPEALPLSIKRER